MTNHAGPRSSNPVADIEAANAALCDSDIVPRLVKMARALVTNDGASREVRSLLESVVRKVDDVDAALARVAGDELNVPLSVGLQSPRLANELAPRIAKLTVRLAAFLADDEPSPAGAAELAAALRVLDVPGSLALLAGVENVIGRTEGN